MTNTIQYIEPELSGVELKIGVVMARFNAPICHGLRDACLSELLKLGVSGPDIVLVTVPGALEIPFALQNMAMTGQFDALIALGAVVRGETYHFELVSNESGSGITQVSLEHDIPIANAILTTENEAQAEARMVEKGAEAARVAVEMANLQYVFHDEDEAVDSSSSFF